MVAALVWKECREHRNVWVALAALAGLLIGGLFFLLDPPGVASQAAGKHSMMILAGLVVAGTYGVVCGSMMLADERDAGTLSFLDALTARRTPIWRTKLLLGMLFTLLQATLIAAILVPLTPHSIERALETETAYIFLAAMVVAFEAYVWGFFLSGFFRSALTAAGTGALLVVLLWSISLGAVFVVSFAVFILRGVFLIGALWGSWRMFCGDDRERVVHEGVPFGRLVAAPFSLNQPAWKWLLPAMVVVIATSTLLNSFIGFAASLGLLFIATAVAGATMGTLALAAEPGQGAAGRSLLVWGLRVFLGLMLTVLLTLTLLPALSLIAPDGQTREAYGFLRLIPTGIEALVWGVFFAALLRGPARYGVTFGAGLALALAFAGGDVTASTFRAVAALAALAASALIFVSRNKVQAPAPSPVPVSTPSPVRTPRGPAAAVPVEAESVWARLWPIVWLTLRQGWTLTAVLGVGAVAVGFVLPAFGVVVWPVFTLLAGLLCGISVYAGEQLAGTHRFLGDQRLPPGRVWLVKTSMWLALALLISGIALLVAAVFGELTGKPRSFHDKTAEDLQRMLGESALLELADPTLFLTLWAGYGFAVGQFFGLLCKKPPVAGVLSLLIAPVLAGLWIPSLVGGGLHAWQVFLPPAILLFATRLGFWTWTAGMLHRPKPILALSLVGGLAVLALAGGLWYRVLEVPDLGEPFDVAAFEAGFPTPEQNRAGSVVRVALREVASLEDEWRRQFPPLAPGLPPAEAEGRVAAAAELALLASQPGLIEAIGSQAKIWMFDSGIPFHWRDQIDELSPFGRVKSEGWFDREPQIARQVSFLFDEREWWKQLSRLRELPLGVVADPRFIYLRPPGEDHLHYARSAGSWLVVRALEQEHKGDAEAALRCLGTALALSRNLQNRGLPFAHWEGAQIESDVLHGLEHWINQPAPRRQLLWEALEELTWHERSKPGYSDVIKAEYASFRGAMASPTSQFLMHMAVVLDREQANQFVAESGFLTLIWQAPWEQLRRRRILNALFHARLKESSDQAPDSGRVGETPIERLAREHMPGLNAPAMISPGWLQLLTDARWPRMLSTMTPEPAPIPETAVWTGPPHQGC